MSERPPATEGLPEGPEAPPRSTESSRPPETRPRRFTPFAFAASLVSLEPRRVLVPVVLFLLALLSTLYVGRFFVEDYGLEVGVAGGTTGTLLDGWPYALPLMAILLCHEMGHYVAARIHGVPVTLPYFLPVPFFFGTFGAVIRTRGRIRSRNALMDVGAAGPLAGMLVAVPCMIAGLAMSEVRELPKGPYQLEGQSILYGLLKLVVVGPIPAGHDVFLHPLAWAAWIGFLVTMINLIPVGQLDGGHVAYALFGRSYDAVSTWAHRVLVILGVLIGTQFGLQAWLGGRGAWEVAGEFATGLNWIVWAGVLWLLSRATKGRHPPVDDESLSPGRKALGILCVVLFVTLFMVVPLRAVSP